MTSSCAGAWGARFRYAALTVMPTVPIGQRRDRSLDLLVRHSPAAVTEPSLRSCPRRSEEVSRESSVAVEGRGPLAPHGSGVVAELEHRGYADASVAEQMKLLANLSRWMIAVGMGYRHFRSSRALEPLVAYLRAVAVPVVATPVEAVSVRQVDVLVERYRGYLVGERGLAAGTVCCHVSIAGRFLEAQASMSGELDVAGLTAGMVSRDVLIECRSRKRGSSESVVIALRSLLRFLHVDGFTSGELASATGRRDFAVLLVLSRLGLRAGELSAIGLRDVDWRAGELLVRGKARRRDRLPLPVDVGEAIADYLQHGRPRVALSRLLMRAIAPIGPLTSDAVSGIVRYSCHRAGLPAVGAHRLRHTAGTEALRAGGSLAEIGQLLRQQTEFTTSLYARVDRSALRELGRRWPEARR
jgi:integrase/recombinase XerD